jgi:hypothetical protein
MASLSGPHPISAQYQVKIPTKLARELHLQKGDLFFWRLSDDDPAVLTLIPSEVVERRYVVGEQAEAATRPRGTSLGAAPSEDLSTPVVSDPESF